MRTAATPLSPADEAREDYDTWLEAHDAEVAAKALRDAADAWTQGQWSDVMLPKPTPPAIPVIAYSNRVGDWLRDRANAAEAGDLEFLDEHWSESPDLEGGDR